jgi:plasmid stabilization system protein ParE
MPYSVAFSEVAELHLQEIEAYLAERFYPVNAERFVQRLTKACLALGVAPYRGTKPDDLAPGIRTTGFERRATIYFKVVDERVYILGVYYGGRQFEMEL